MDSVPQLFNKQKILIIGHYYRHHEYSDDIHKNTTLSHLIIYYYGSILAPPRQYNPVNRKTISCQIITFM